MGETVEQELAETAMTKKVRQFFSWKIGVTLSVVAPRDTHPNDATVMYCFIAACSTESACTELDETTNFRLSLLTKSYIRHSFSIWCTFKLQSINLNNTFLFVILHFQFCNCSVVSSLAYTSPVVSRYCFCCIFRLVYLTSLYLTVLYMNCYCIRLVTIWRVKRRYKKPNTAFCMLTTLCI